MELCKFSVSAVSDNAKCGIDKYRVNIDPILIQHQYFFNQVVCIITLLLNFYIFITLKCFVLLISQDHRQNLGILGKYLSTPFNAFLTS